MHDPADVVEKRVPGFKACYEDRQWRMFDRIERVYINEAARRDLGWQPKIDFAHVLSGVRRGRNFTSDLAQEIDPKGYHEQSFTEGPYPVECE